VKTNKSLQLLEGGQNKINNLRKTLPEKANAPCNCDHYKVATHPTTEQKKPRISAAFPSDPIVIIKAELKWPAVDHTNRHLSLLDLELGRYRQL